MEFGIEFSLSISDRTLQNYTIVLHGDAELSVAGDLYTELSYSDAKSWLITTICMQPIDFFIGGIPFFISMTIPIQIGYEISASVETRMATNVKAQVLKFKKITMRDLFVTESRVLKTIVNGSMNSF